MGRNVSRKYFSLFLNLTGAVGQEMKDILYENIKNCTKMLKRDEKIDNIVYIAVF